MRCLYFGKKVVEQPLLRNPIEYATELAARWFLTVEIENVQAQRVGQRLAQQPGQDVVSSGCAGEPLHHVVQQRVLPADNRTQGRRAGQRGRHRQLGELADRISSERS
ncbi:Uncharacterised protein [Mycobacteroides abscessus subsp. massiliense]|nr:Uncharacterised protein [Mycobacteroides abscessus subsp. massiliense]